MPSGCFSDPGDFASPIASAVAVKSPRDLSLEGAKQKCKQLLMKLLRLVCKLKGLQLFVVAVMKSHCFFSSFSIQSVLKNQL